VLDRRALAMKDQLALRYADLVYDGRWWGTEREALDAMVDRTQQRVTGTVRLKLYKGNAIIAGRTSPFSLYHEGLASFGNDGSYDHADAAGFIRLFALPTRVEALQSAQMAAVQQHAVTPQGVPGVEHDAKIPFGTNGAANAHTASANGSAAPVPLPKVGV
jgi:argininosuccinate synthase